MCLSLDFEGDVCLFNTQNYLDPETPVSKGTKKREISKPLYCIN